MRSDRHPAQTPANAPQLARAVGRWLADERRDDEAAEASLAAVFSALPAPAPRADFAARVLAAAGIRRRARDLRGRVRFLVAAALVSTAGAIFLVLPSAWVLLGVVGPGAAFAGLFYELAELFAAVVHVAIDLLALGEGVARFARTVWLLATSPEGAIFLLSLTVLTYALSRWLVALVSGSGAASDPRSFSHATPA